MEDQEVLAKEVDSVLEKANSIVITTFEQAEGARDYIKDTIKYRRKKIKEKFDPICDAANVAHKTATSARKSLLDPLDKAEKMIKLAVGKYVMEQQAIAEKAAAKAEEKARRDRVKAFERAEKRIATLLEKAGGVQSQITVLEDQLSDITLELSEADQEAIENRLNILRLKKEQADQAVEAKKEEVETIPYTPPPSAPAPQKIKGMNTRIAKEPEVVSLMLLAKAVVEGKQAISMLLPNMQMIQKMVDAGHNVQGVNVHKKTITTVR